jgi:hypothetical protein
MNEMEIAQENSNGENESESCTTTDELTESSENLFLRNISEIIANSERNSMSVDGCGSLMIEEVKSIVQPQFGYFLPLALTPRMRAKRLRLNINLINFIITNKIFFVYFKKKFSNF